MILINIDAAFVFSKGVGGVLCFHATGRFPLLYLFYHFFLQSRNSVIFVFSFLVVNLIVSVSSVFSSCA